jgi:solute carrier family 25, member 39/40
MAGCSRGSFPIWMTAAASRVDLAGGAAASPSSSSQAPPATAADQELGMVERALSAAGAAFISAIIVNPLDVAKVSGLGSLVPLPLSPPAFRVQVPAVRRLTRFVCLSRWMQTRLQAQAAGVQYHHPPQMAALGPDAVRNPIPSCFAWGRFLGACFSARPLISGGESWVFYTCIWGQ